MAGEEFTIQLVIETSDPLVLACADMCREYAAELLERTGVDLLAASYQSFRAEIAELPGVYGPALGGVLMVALRSADQAPMGIIAYKVLDAEARIVEMKRMFVRPEARSRGLGWLLCNELIEHARQAHMATMKLDTLGRLASAVRLYERLGFLPTDPYNVNPGTSF